MKTIVVPVDFSEVSVNAALYATDMALALHADLILLHVLPLPVLVADVPVPLNLDGMSSEEATLLMKSLTDRLAKRSNDKLCITSQIHTGNFREEMKQLGKWPFAVVMGTAGAGYTEAFFLGSFTLMAAKTLECPLILVPPGYSYRRIRKIGLASDMKAVAGTVPFDTIRNFVTHFDAALELLYISRPGENMYPEVLQESRTLQDGFAGLQPATRITTHEDIQEGLGLLAEKEDIDILVLVPGERNFIAALLHSSMTKKMILQPQLPLMIVHP